MPISAPIHVLKRQARQLARAEAIALHAALDKIAAREGFRAWSLLMARTPEPLASNAWWTGLDAGDLVLIAGRPGQGKTRMAMELLIETAIRGRPGTFFTLEYTEADVMRLLSALGVEARDVPSSLTVDTSDAICADYIIDAMAAAPRGSIVVIDYLQLLDQKREHPPLAAQVEALRSFALAQGLVIACISQVDRKFDLSRREFPGPDDVRLPNPLDLTLFAKCCFVNEGKVEVRTLT